MKIQATCRNPLVGDGNFIDDVVLPTVLWALAVLPLISLALGV